MRSGNDYDRAALAQIGFAPIGELRRDGYAVPAAIENLGSAGTAESFGETLGAGFDGHGAQFHPFVDTLRNVVEVELLDTDDFYLGRAGGSKLEIVVKGEVNDVGRRTGRRVLRNGRHGRQ